jgi:hypothetical protein
MTKPIVCADCGTSHGPLTLTEQLDPEDIFAWIVRLEERVSDWAFTLKLTDHFNGLKQKYFVETKDDPIARRLRDPNHYGEMPKVD